MMGHAVLRPHRRYPYAERPRLMRRTDGTNAVETPESLLLRVASSGDVAAFQRLFEHFAPRIKSYLIKGGASSQVAEDLAQEAMLSVWRKAALFDPGRAAASTWIFTIARNLRIDLARRERHPGFDPADPALMPEASDGSHDALQARQDAELLHSALKDLPPDQSEIVQLSFFSDKPHSEIAAQLGLPLGTVKSRIRLAMARLRGVLESDT